jgi:rubrerythrin
MFRVEREPFYPLKGTEEMPQEFNIDEIFTIAVDIEKNGEKFYRRAAELATDQDAKKLLADLADWEKGHIKIFSDLHARLKDANLTWDPYGEVELYLQAVANRQVFTNEHGVVEFAENHSSLREILEFALAREKDAVVFYTSLDMVAGDLSDGKVNAIIKEEISHIRLITEKLAQLG